MTDQNSPRPGRAPEPQRPDTDAPNHIPTPSSSQDDTPPPGGPAQTSLADDAREVGAKIKENLDPKRAALNAGAHLLGAKAALDTAKTGKAYTEAEQELGNDEQPESTAPARSSGMAGNEQGSSGSNGPGTGQETGALRKGASVARKGADRGLSHAGKSVGASDAGRFVRKSGSSGTLGGDTKAISGGAKDGAVIGAKVGGGIGALVGGAAGGILEGAKTKWGRRWIKFCAASVFLGPVIVPIAFVLVIMLTIGGGIVTGAMSTQDDGDAVETAMTDQVSAKAIGLYQSAGSDSNLPWEIFAAITYVQGDNPDGEAVEPLSDEEAKEALADNSEVGPYRLLASDAAAEAKRYDLDLDLSRMNDLEASTRFVGPLLTAYMEEAVSARDNPEDVDDFNFATGVTLSEQEADEEGDGDQERFLIGSDPSGNNLGIDPEGEADADHVALRETYLAALQRLPIKDAEVNAERIYSVALMWYLGRSVACNTSLNGTPGAGAWSNPAVGPITSPFGMRVHPITGELKLHDGTDISAPAGQTVYAAGAGTVTIMDEAWSGSKNLVSIDHGSGITTEYGHMSKVLVTEGQQVTPGTPVGQVGSEGASTGAHLHFIVTQDGEFIDPEPFMRSKGVNLGVDDPQKPVSGGGDESGGTTGIGETGDGTNVPSSVPGGKSGSVTGAVTISQANIPKRNGWNAVVSSMPKVLARKPDFVSLNEMSAWTVRGLTGVAPGYDGFRSTFPPDPGQAGNHAGSVILWKASEWKSIAKGRIQIVNDERVYYNGQLKVWDRYAQWVLLQRNDGAIVGFISTHHMLNPDKSNPNKPLRRQQYGEGMDKLAALIGVLNEHGPVFMAGDMNSHVYQVTSSWSAAAKMKALGYSWANHSVDFIFAPPGVKKIGEWDGPMASDHNWLTGTFSMDGKGAGGPLAPVGGTGTLPESWQGENSLGESITLDRKQLEFAAEIARTGNEMGVSADGVIIAFMVVLVEGKFKNYASDVYPATMNDPRVYPKGTVGSDHDSVGLFQQRPESGWGPKVVYSPGSPDDRNSDALWLLEPGNAAQAFFGGPQGPNAATGSPAGLLGQAGWETRDKGEVAQAVQRSAYPDRYATWETAATALYDIVSGATGGAANCEDGMATSEANEYKVGTLNVLGWNHTEEGGNKASWPDGDVRFPAAMRKLETEGVSIVGLQEMHAKNQTMFRSDYSETWGYHQGSQDYVIWRKDEWRDVRKETVTIPYFGNEKRRLPFVLLEQISTGEKVWFMGIHNPADVGGNNFSNRKEALRIEKAAVESVKSQGYPVFVVGDFNDSRDGGSRSQCILAPPMRNVFGDSPSGCQKPRNAPNIDHIYSLNVTTTDAKEDTSLEAEQIADHPLVTAVVPQAGSGSAQTVVDWALKQVGKGYSQAQDLRLGPTHYDCSGLVYMAWKQAGVTLPLVSRDQATFGKKISRSELKPGDLIFYYSPVSHVSMYIGERNGEPYMVHAANPRSGVEVVPLSYMAGHEVGYRRVTQ